MKTIGLVSGNLLVAINTLAVILGVAKILITLIK